MSETDLQLLARYAGHHAEDAFAELVRRHVDMVHSAALRQVRSPQLAEEVAQSAFITLAHHAGRLRPDSILTAWLYQVTRRAAVDVIRREARRQLREQIATHIHAMNATDNDWPHVEPLLDEAMAALDETDRTAVLLRYFQNKSLRDVGLALGTSEDTAQKRVSRAVERLREFFARHDVTVGASGLAVALSAHAVQAAPSTLAATITLSAASLATTATITQVIAMTALQKTLVTAALAAAALTAIYEVRQAGLLSAENQALRQQHSEQIQQLQKERDEASDLQSRLRKENDRLQGATSDLLKLRAEVTRLKAGEQELARLRAENQRPASAAAQPADTELPKDSWVDAGFATPQAVLRTRGWSVLNGNREKFKESVFITEGARKTMEDMLVRMAEASNDPNKSKYLEEIINNKFGVEEGILLPMMAENKKKGFTGYHILTQQSPSPDEAQFEVETRMTSAPPKKETLKFRRFSNDWKIVIDEDFIKAAH